MFETISGIIGAAGPLGVAFLMFLENVFPPVPSELIMPLAGFEAAGDPLRLAAFILAGTAGSVAGALLWYWVGLRIPHRRLCRLAEKHGRWLTIGPEDIDRSIGWFERHGRGAVFFGRLLPGIRTFISVPAGLSRMPFLRVLVYSTAGSLLWTAFLTVAGYVLRSQYDRVQNWLDPVTYVVIGGLVAVYVWRVARFGRRAERRERTG